MKTTKFYVWTLLVVFTSMTFLSCEENNDKPAPPLNPLLGRHFDIWVSIGGTSGMGSENTQVVKSIKSLETQELIDFKGTGTDVTAKLYQEAIVKGQYYYQIPKEKDRFGKYRIVNNQIEIVKEFPFKNNTLKDRRYTHAWINENTLILMAANGKGSKVIWIKVDTGNMKIINEGELNLPALPEGGKFSTSGIASYRADDGKIIYSYLDNKDKVRFYVAFINPTDMSVEKTVMEDRAEMMAGTAYGELLQNKTFFDKNGDYYIACNTKIPGSPGSTQQFGTLLRIKKGTLEMDKTYTGYRKEGYSKGKIVTVDYLNNDKALLYIQDPVHTGAKGWGSDYNCYYAVLDLKTDDLQELKLPFSEGTFSQRSIVIADKAYIGVNPKDNAPQVYIYETLTGKLTKGISITEGYSFDRIVSLKD